MHQQSMSPIGSVCNPVSPINHWGQHTKPDLLLLSAQLTLLHSPTQCNQASLSLSQQLSLSYSTSQFIHTHTLILSAQISLPLSHMCAHTHTLILSAQSPSLSHTCAHTHTHSFSQLNLLPSLAHVCTHSFSPLSPPSLTHVHTHIHTHSLSSISFPLSHMCTHTGCTHTSTKLNWHAPSHSHTNHLSQTGIPLSSHTPIRTVLNKARFLFSLSAHTSRHLLTQNHQDLHSPQAWELIWKETFCNLPPPPFPCRNLHFHGQFPCSSPSQLTPRNVHACTNSYTPLQHIQEIYQALIFIMEFLLKLKSLATSGSTVHSRT